MCSGRGKAASKRPDARANFLLRVLPSFSLLWPSAFAIAPLFAVRSGPPSVLHQDHALACRVLRPSDPSEPPHCRRCAVIGLNPPPFHPAMVRRFRCAAAVAAATAPPSVGSYRRTLGAVPPLPSVGACRRASGAALPLPLRHRTVRVSLRVAVAAPPSVGGHRRTYGTASPPPLRLRRRRRYCAAVGRIPPSRLRSGAAASAPVETRRRYSSTAAQLGVLT